MAADIGLDEVKVVFLTAFSDSLVSETLYGCEDEVEEVFQDAIQRAEKQNILLKLPYIRGKDPAGDKNHRDCYVSYRDFYLGSDGYVRPCMSTADKFFKYNPKMDFNEIWNSEMYQQYRKAVNSENMEEHCKNCYQSSHCNWNKKKSYIQVGEVFAPEWEKSK